jgi:hypothetical protein
MGYSTGVPRKVRLTLNQLLPAVLSFASLHSVVSGALAPSVCKHVRNLAFSYLSLLTVCSLVLGVLAGKVVFDLIRAGV